MDNDQQKNNQPMDQSEDKMSREEAGKLGGEARKQELGHEGFVKLGQQGGEATAESHDSNFYQDIGQEGGSAPRSESDDQDKED